MCFVSEKCARVHWHLPYKWEVFDTNGTTWKDVPDMEDVEKAFCDPARDTSFVAQTPSFTGIFNKIFLGYVKGKNTDVHYSHISFSD